MITTSDNCERDDYKVDNKSDKDDECDAQHNDMMMMMMITTRTSL